MPKRRQPTRIFIDGRQWRIVRARLRRLWGDCDYELGRIRINSRLVGEDLLNTLILEILHARFPDLSEQSVRDFSDELAGVVNSFGFEIADHEEEP